MAYIATRANSLIRQRIRPSFTSILNHHHQDDEDQNNPNHHHHPSPPPPAPKTHPHRPQNSPSTGFTNPLFRTSHYTSSFLFPSGLGSSYCNYSSSSAINEQASDNIDFIGEVLTDKAVDLASQAAAVPGASEVAIAAADSYLPVAALQHFIGGVHSVTGFNWWASIALTTLLIRCATVPLLINQLKASTKLALLRPKLEEIKQRMQDRAMDPNAVSEGQRQMQAIFKEHGVTPFSPLKGILIQGPVFISFFLAINNMVEKVPSFKEGGIFWFTDLTTPDSLYVLPVLTSLTFLITVECNMQEGMEGNSAAGTMKTFSRILAFLTIPFTMSFPKAIFCYWITSNFFSLVYGLAMKRPQVKKLLGLPEVPRTPNSKQAPFDLFAAFKQLKAVMKEPLPLPAEPLKLPAVRTSSSVINQRIRNLEKQVKGRKKNKRR